MGYKEGKNSLKKAVIAEIWEERFEMLSSTKALIFALIVFVGAFIAQIIRVL